MSGLKFEIPHLTQQRSQKVSGLKFEIPHLTQQRSQKVSGLMRHSVFIWIVEKQTKFAASTNR